MTKKKTGRGGKASKGRPKNINSKAPLAQEESDEVLIEEETPRTSKKNPNIIQKQNKKIYINGCVQILYKKDEYHIFQSLNNRPGCIAIDDIILKDFDKHNV